MEMNIKLNSIKCRKCGNILVSEHRHDFKTCHCGAVSVDGGLDYIRRCGDKKDFEELSIYDEK